MASKTPLTDAINARRVARGQAPVVIVNNPESLPVRRPTRDQQTSAWGTYTGRTIATNDQTWE